MRVLGKRLAAVGDRGASVVEFAILMPFVIALIFLIVQAGLYYHAVNVSQAVAQSTARQVRGFSTGGTATDCGQVDSQQAQATAIEIWQTLDAHASAAQPVVAATVGDKCEVTVTVESHSVNLLPGIFPRLDIHAKASGPLEVFKTNGTD